MSMMYESSFRYDTECLTQAVGKFFEKTYVRKKTVTASKGTKRKRGARTSLLSDSIPMSQAQEAELVVEQQEVLLEEPGNTVDAEELELADTQAGEAQESVALSQADDPDRAAHDEALVKGLHAVAITHMAERGVLINAHQTADALKILPKVSRFSSRIILFLLTLDVKVSGLARRVHDSTALRLAFEQQVLAEGPLQGLASTLVRRVVTRWNSDLAALRSHITLENPVQRLTGQTSNKVSAYRLTSDQWELARHLADLLAVSTSVFLAHVLIQKLIVS
jgi:hypothetical protein